MFPEVNPVLGREQAGFYSGQSSLHTNIQKALSAEHDSMRRLLFPVSHRSYDCHPESDFSNIE